MRLRALAPRDLARIEEWLRDAEVRAAFSGPPPREVGAGRPAWAWGVWSRHPGGRESLIGWVELDDVEPRAGRAELRVCLGRKELWGRGYGPAAVRLALERAFSELSLHEVYLRVAVDNRRAIRAYRKCGFVAEGIFRAGRHAALGLTDHLLMTVRRPAPRRGGRARPA